MLIQLANKLRLRVKQGHLKQKSRIEWLRVICTSVGRSKILLCYTFRTGKLIKILQQQSFPQLSCKALRKELFQSNISKFLIRGVYKLCCCNILPLTIYLIPNRSMILIQLLKTFVSQFHRAKPGFKSLLFPFLLIIINY